MSFSAQVKEELCRNSTERLCCVRAEAYGALLYCHTFRSGEVRVVTECPPFKERLPVLFRRAFGVEFDEVPPAGEGKGAFRITGRDKLRAIFDAYGHEMDRAPSIHVNFAVAEEACCRLSLFRGAFLAGGAVTDPRKSYHLELATPHYHVGREMPVLLREAGFDAKETRRRSNYVAYFKHAGRIEEFLTAIGAPEAARDLAGSRREREVRGSVNRRVNCDSANLDKTVAASQNQCDAIRRLEREGRLSALTPELRQTARLRRDNPELTLSQLTELFDPPISKSALNHRLHRLVELTEER